MSVTAQTAAIHTYGAQWLQTISNIHVAELGRVETSFELAEHLAWILEQRDGGWDAQKITAFVRGLDEWRIHHQS